MLINYYETENEFWNFYSNLKITLCPKCKQIGSLNLHGKLYGYADDDSLNKIVRGRRIFCNNRKKHNNGCGHSFVVWDTQSLKHSSLGSQGLWLFLKSLLNSSCKLTALRSMKLGLANSSAYRIFNRFLLSQSKLRTRLLAIQTPPEDLTYTEPFRQTIQHIEMAFPDAICPITSFQKYFQMSFL